VPSQAKDRCERSGSITPGFAAQYLHAQIGLAASQRALGTEPAAVRKIMERALAILRS
jgi:hypothetical protein